MSQKFDTSEAINKSYNFDVSGKVIWGAVVVIVAVLLVADIILMLAIWQDPPTWQKVVFYIFNLLFGGAFAYGIYRDEDAYKGTWISLGAIGLLSFLVFYAHNWTIYRSGGLGWLIAFGVESLALATGLVIGVILLLKNNKTQEPTQWALGVIGLIAWVYLHYFVYQKYLVIGGNTWLIIGAVLIVIVDLVGTFYLLVEHEESRLPIGILATVAVIFADFTEIHPRAANNDLLPIFWIVNGIVVATAILWGVWHFFEKTRKYFRLAGKTLAILAGIAGWLALAIIPAFFAVWNHHPWGGWRHPIAIAWFVFFFVVPPFIATWIYFRRQSSWSKVDTEGAFLRALENGYFDEQIAAQVVAALLEAMKTVACIKLMDQISNDLEHLTPETIAKAFANGEVSDDEPVESDEEDDEDGIDWLDDLAQPEETS